MINVNDLKVAMTIEMDGNIYTVIELGHVNSFINFFFLV